MNSSRKTDRSRRRRRLMGWVASAIAIVPGVALAADPPAEVKMASAQVGSYFSSDCPPVDCPCPPAGQTPQTLDGSLPPVVSPTPATDSNTGESTPDVAAPQTPDQFSDNSISNDVDAVMNAPANNAAPLNSFAATGGGLDAPDMIGDFFGSTYSFGSSSMTLGRSTVPTAGGDRRFKIAENVSPTPRDRVFYNYNHFENAVTDINGNSYALNRHVIGVEKTALDGLVSAEIRMPFVFGLNSTQDFSGSSAQNTGFEFGNLSAAVKLLLHESCTTKVSAGLSMIFPTGDDGVFTNSAVPNRSFTYKNESTHLAPFLGFLHQPNDLWFYQGFLSVDFDTRGNRLIFNDGGTIEQAVVQDQTLLFADLSVGRWLYQNRCAQHLTGLAGIVEAHYTTTLNGADEAALGGDTVLQGSHPNVVNLTAGLVAQLRSGTSIRVAAGAPISSDKFFDSEIQFQVNRRF